MSRSVLHSITDATGVSAVRRAAMELANATGFDETATGKIGIIATEAANNLWKHARDGKIIFRRLDEQKRKGLEILAVDKGPGMTDVSKCLRDGFSTAGSAGTGLGAISRLSDFFDIYSASGGTGLLSQNWVGGIPKKRDPFQTGAVCLPRLDETACGDDWFLRQTPTATQLLVVDGLGHGIGAAEVADLAVATFSEMKELSPVQIVSRLHGVLRAGRGASLAVANIDLSENLVRYAGVGNISGTILEGAQTRSLISHNGIVGHEMPRAHEFQYPWSAGCTLVMHSDGLTSKWKLDSYPGLLARHPALIAGVLFRDFQRTRDDISVVVIRLQPRRTA